MIPDKGSFGWEKGLEVLEALSNEIGDNFEVLNFAATSQKVDIRVKIPYEVTNETFLELREWFAEILNPLGAEHVWPGEFKEGDETVKVQFTVYNREKGYFKRG